MGSINRSFSQRESGMDTGEIAIEEAKKIARQYADFLQAHAPLPGRVADASQLPQHKEVIKDALAVCIRASQDPGLTNNLKHDYLLLSSWQYGLGEKSLGVDFSGIDLEADPLDLAELIQAQSANMNYWDPLIKAEQTVLVSELIALGV